MNVSTPLFPIAYSTLAADALLKLIQSQYSEVKSGYTIRFLKRGFNDTYVLESSKKGSHRYILRVFKHQWRNLESIETEVNLLQHLDSTVSVSLPIADDNGHYIQSIQAPEGVRYAVLFTFAEGVLVRKLDVQQAYLLGVEVGKLHAKTANLNLGVTAQNYDITHQFNKTLTNLKPILAAHPEQYDYLLKLKTLFEAKFNSIDKTQVATGICHGDLQAENFHVDANNTYTFFDFDFFGTGYLAYDIGVFMWYDHKNKTPQIMNSFFNGYKTQRALTDTELALIPYFGTLRALFQMTLYCNLSDGIQQPIWPAEQVAAFVNKAWQWQQLHTAKK